MDEQRMSRAADFIWRNARLLERRLFSFIFEGGDPRLVASALKAYQNADGGFGNALEPDKRTPHSHPVDVQIAFELLDRVGLMGDAQIQRDMLLPACDFLESIRTAQGGVPFSLRTANPYPTTDWWLVAEDLPAALNPTAAITGLLVKYRIQHPFVEKSIAYCWEAIAASETEQYHDLLPMIAFLSHVPERDRAQAELARIAERMRKPGVVAYDRSQPGYLKFPLDWAPFPEHFCRSLFTDAVIREDMRALAASQQPDGGWPITWEPVSVAVALEWRGWATVQALWSLRLYEEAG